MQRDRNQQKTDQVGLYERSGITAQSALADSDPQIAGNDWAQNEPLARLCQLALPDVLTTKEALEDSVLCRGTTFAIRCDSAHREFLLRRPIAPNENSADPINFRWLVVNHTQVARITPTGTYR